MTQGNLLAEHNAIRELEQLLRKQISVAKGSPFIAHYVIEPNLEEAAREQLVRSIDGCDRRLHEFLLKFPCVCTRVIAMSLSESYGGDGDAAVYQHIARRLEIGETVSVGNRGKLNRCFRRACGSQGLALPPRRSGTPRMVNDYLFQAGVSRSQLPKLAGAFLRAEEILGLPPEDDTRQVDDWEDRAVDFAPPGLTVLRRIVRDDPTAFHATTFINLQRDTGTSECSDFELALRDAIEAVSSAERGGVSADQAPSLEFSDGGLRVTIPRGADVLDVRVRDRSHRLSGGRNLALPLPWPSVIEWQSHRNAAASPDWHPLRIFSDSSRVLVFDGDSGLRKCELDTSRPSEATVPAGLICLVAQHPFRANGEHSHQLGERASVLYCEILKGLKIQIDDLEFDVEVDPRLRLEVDGVRIIRDRSAWLLARPTTVRVYGETGRALEGLEVRVGHCALRETLRLPVRRATDGSATAPLALPEGGEFDLARVSLHVPGQERALYRYKFWFWPGLDRLLDGRLFAASSIPENLSHENLSHICRTSDGHLAF